MQKYTVVMGRGAIADLINMRRHVEHEAGFDVSARYLDKIEKFCRGFDILPQRGAPRDDIRAGLRIAIFERSLTIAYRIKDQSVIILRVLGAGQDVVAQLTQLD